MLSFATTGRNGSQNEATLLYPRGKVLSSQPNFVWLSVANATSYILRIENTTLELTTVVPSVGYPPNWTPLAPGKYHFIVQPLDYASHEIPGTRTVTEITVASPQEIQTFQQRLQFLATLIASPNYGGLIEAIQYIDAGYDMDAISHLEQFLKINIQGISGNVPTPAPNNNPILNSSYPYFLLGILYEKQGLTDYAVSAYRMAFDVAITYQYPDSLARASEKLGILDVESKNRYCLLEYALTYYTSTTAEISTAKANNIQYDMERIANRIGSTPSCTDALYR